MTESVIYAGIAAASRVRIADAFPGFRFTWTGWDGSEWDLTTGREGVTLMSGVRGLRRPPHRRWSSSAPLLAGSRHLGSQLEDAEPFWPIRVQNRLSSRAWIATDSAFWRTMNPELPGMWTVTDPDGRQRTLMCRYHDHDEVFTTDPARMGRAVYGIRLLADNPRWQGEPITTPAWQVSSGQSFIPTAAEGGGPPFRISPATVLANARVTNPGDAPAYPVWTITGPTSSETVITVDGQAISYPVLGSGQSVRIFTDPRREVAIRENGSDVSNLMTSHLFAPFQPYTTTDIGIDLTGTGSVQATFTPEYDGAW